MEKVSALSSRAVPVFFYTKPAGELCRIQNSAVGNFSPKTEGTKTKAARCIFFWCLSLPEHFEFFAIFSYCFHFAKFVCLLKRLQRLKQEWHKSLAGTRQTYGKN
jgi:hypothetical protein